jgi:hypothetical protein
MRQSLGRSLVVGGVTLSFALAWASLTMVTMSQELAKTTESLARLSEQHNELRKHLAGTGVLPAAGGNSAMPDSMTAVEGGVDQQDKRRLADARTIVATGSNTDTAGCNSIAFTADESRDMSSTTCANSKRCPQCFIATSLDQARSLEIVKCSTLIHGPSSSYSDRIYEFTFANMDTADTLTIKSAATAGGAILSQYDLAPLESVVAFCIHAGTGSAPNILFFPFSHGTPASNNKKGYLDKLTTSDPGGNIAWDTNSEGAAGDSVNIVGFKTTGNADNMQTLGLKIGTAPDNTVTFTSGAITVGHLTTKDGVAQDFINNIGTAPDGAVTFTSGAITVGFATADAHGYLTKLGAADPATNAITYVAYGTDADANSNCAGTAKFICEG